MILHEDLNIDMRDKSCNNILSKFSNNTLIATRDKAFEI